MKGYVEQLRDGYSKIFSQSKQYPTWAVKKSNIGELVHPSIPFVGKNYDETKLLLYASMENLMYYVNQGGAREYLDDDEIAIDRHRYCFEGSKRGFFRMCI